jgi:WD40 repeat protein
MRESFISAALAPGAAGPANSERTPVAYVGTNDGRIFALSQTGSLLYSLSTQHAAVTQLAVSRDGQRLAAGSRDGTALIWEGQTQKQRIELGDKPRAVHFYPDDYTLEVALPLHLVRYDWRAGTERSRRSQDVEIARVEHPHGGHWTAMRTGSDSGRLLLLQDTAATPYTVTNSQVSEVAFALARDQKFLALGAKTGVFELTLQPFSVRRRSELSAFAVAISPSGEWLAALHPKALRVYRTRSQEVVKSFALEANFDDTLTWLSDDELSLGRPAGSGANTRFWSLSEGEGETLKGAVYPLTPSKLVLEGDTLRKLRGRQDSEVAKGVQAPVAANAAGSHFAYLSGGALVVHDVGRGAERRYDFSAAADHLALSASAKRAALVSYPRRLWSIDLESGAVLELAKGAHAGLGDFNSLAFYGDEWILAGGTDGLLAIHATDPTQKGGVHLSSNGSWFSTVNRAATSFVDGDEAGIDGVAAAPVAAPGLYWEGLRREGSFVELLKGTLPADE